MLSCREVTKLCSQELERPLTAGERVSLHIHFLVCEGCQIFREQMVSIRKAIHDYAGGRAASAEDKSGPGPSS